MPYYRGILVDSDGYQWNLKNCSVSFDLKGPVNKNKPDGTNGGSFQFANLIDGTYALKIYGAKAPAIDAPPRTFTVAGQNINDTTPFQSSDKNPVHALVLASVIATCEGLEAPLDPASVTVTGTPPIPTGNIVVLPDSLDTTIFINDLDPQTNYLITIAQSEYSTADSPFTRTPSDGTTLSKTLLFTKS